MIPLIDDRGSEEFKVHLCKPSGAALGRYLRTCRVKVIDSDTFPSSKYESQLLQGKQGVSEIRTIGLLWEYWKLCFLQLPGIGKRSCLVVFLDQFRNAYRVILLALNMYMVDVLFNTGNPDTEKQLIGGGFDQPKIRKLSVTFTDSVTAV